jgi:cytochrome c oxidase cbb3-type subunit 3
VGDDTAGSTLAPVIRNGRPDKGMPAFPLSEPDLAAVVAFIHSQRTKAESQKGGRRGVDVADLQTGDAAAGKRYFDGACASCHSATGDLSGIGTRLKGLRLEQRMLYPRGAKESITVKLPDGQTVTGTVAYRDEFTVALRDAAGRYRSWSTDRVTYTVAAPAEAHVELLPKYTDDDVHNLMAYLQSLR